jgi:antitoxin component of RelBE/YafQ-DinJ toxin-antitoxin module
MSHTLTVRIDAVLAARLEEAAARTGQPVSTLVRQLVRAWLDEERVPVATTLLGRAGSIRGSGASATNANVRARMRRAR